MASPNSSDEVNLTDISKMKVVEIKKELKNRGLSTAGTKTELIQRLQGANSQAIQDSISEDGNADTEMIDEDEVLAGVVDEEDFDDDDLTTDAVLAEEPKVIAPVSTISAAKRPAPTAADTPQQAQPKKRTLIRPISISTSTEKENSSQVKSSNIEVDKEKTDASGKNIVKLSSVSVKERLELRAQKFGVPLTEAAKKEARAARFGTVPAAATTNISQISTSTKITILGPTDEVLKKRAERFGGNVSKFALKVEETEKLKKRQERFGVSAATVDNVNEKKKLRAERFKL